MRPLLLILLSIPIGVAFRYCVELTQAARLIGIAISSPAYLSINKNGFQGAVIPPESNKWFYLTTALLLGALGWLWLSFSWADALIGLVVAFLSGTVAQVTFLPRRDGRHFVLRIFGSMVRRVANYERDGDTARARALKELLDKVMVQYAGMITKADVRTTTATRKHTVIAPTALAQERIISKPDADLIFGFTRAEWESYVRQVGSPEGWNMRLLPHDTGTMLARFNSSTGVGTSVKPYFNDERCPPGMIVVGSYYPVGLMQITEEVINKIEQAARLDLGPSYSISANHAKMPDTNLEGIDLIVIPDTVQP